MRYLLPAIVLLVVSISAAFAEDACRWLKAENSPNSFGFEWQESAHRKGARLTASASDWTAVQALEGGYLVGCERCFQGGRLDGFIIPDLTAGQLESRFATETLAEILRNRPPLPDLDIRWKTQPLRARVFGRDGLVALIELRVPGGQWQEALALATKDGCLVLTMILLPAPSQIGISTIKDAENFARGFALETYQPLPSSPPIDPPSPRLSDPACEGPGLFKALSCMGPRRPL